LGKEDEGGEAEVGASSEETGAAPSGGERRRPWRCCTVLGRRGERAREERVEEKERESVVAFSEVSRRSARPSAASRRWHVGGPAQDTQQLAAYWKKKAVFCRKPPRV
jgi:hypothetical protein